MGARITGNEVEREGWRMKIGVADNVLSPRMHLYSGVRGLIAGMNRVYDTPPADTITIPKSKLDELHGIIGRNEDKIKIISDKLNRAEEDKVMILSKVKDLETKIRPPQRQPDDDELPLSQKFNEQNLPQTDEEWNALFDESPAYAADLRHVYNKRVDSHQETFKTCVDELKKKHPEMYLRDSTGAFLLDRDGNVQFDMNSEKGKLFNEIAGQDPAILRVKNGPRIVMEAMENRLKGVSEAKVQKELEEKKAKEEVDRLARVKAGGVADGGGAPPADDPNIKVEWNSQEEEVHVKKMIAKGIYKDEKDYMRTKNANTIGYGRGGF